MNCRLIEFKDGATAIICGSKPDHDCDDKGEIIYEFSDGFKGTLFEKAKQERINLNMCDDDKIYFLYKKDISIRGASVSCSICGRAAIDNMMFI